MDSCIGCAVNGDCSLQHYGSAAMHRCPCRTCILKMMCHDSCEKFSSHCAYVYNPLTQTRINRKEKKKWKTHAGGVHVMGIA
jgi:hypothetical protein